MQSSHQATHQPTVSHILSVSPGDQCSQSRQVSHFSLDFEFKNTQQPTVSQTFCQSLCQNQLTNHRPAKGGEPPAMQSVNWSRQVNHFSLNFAVKITKPPTHQQSAKHYVSLFAKTNQPTTDQLSKEGSRQPCSQSRPSQSQSTKPPTNQQSAKSFCQSQFCQIPINQPPTS